MVFYRKYRPQTISELDLSLVRDKLTAILSSSDVPHAFLFAGPKGLGKTSAARIVAKAINCENRSKIKDQRSKTQNKNKKEEEKNLEQSHSIEPCNKCSSCVSITNGSNIDVIEIDAASNRGVDEIRDLREKVKFSPSSLSKKVYIIDEVHMLTTEAFNALLKTLEEPPKHVIFILATTEIWKLPSTIISRAFVVSFEKPSEKELKGSLLRIIKEEKLDVEDDVFPFLYKYSEGSFRDASKVLEELSLEASDKKITLTLFEKIFKAQSIEKEVEKILIAIGNKKTTEALQIIDDLAQKGVDFLMVNEKMVDFLRLLLLEKSGVDTSLENKDLIPLFDLSSLKDITYDFNESYKSIRYSVLPQLPLELVVIKWKLEGIKIQESRIKDNEKDEKTLKVLESLKKDKSNTRVDQDVFLRLIEIVKKDNHSIAGFLRGCKFVSLNNDNFVLETPFKFHKDKLENLQAKEFIEKKIEELAGRKIALHLNLITKS